MSRVKSADTNPERLVRSLAHGMGYRFRLHRRDLPGCPDLVFPRLHKIIFVHGCFWHGHRGCKRAERPAGNESFWNKKLDETIARDKRNLKMLRRNGWSVLVIWQCRTKNRELLSATIEKFLSE